MTDPARGTRTVVDEAESGDRRHQKGIMKATSLTMGALCVAGIVAAATAHHAGIHTIWIALAAVALAPMIGLELSARRKQKPAPRVASITEAAPATQDEQLAEVIHVDFRRGHAA